MKKKIKPSVILWNCVGALVLIFLFVKCVCLASGLLFAGGIFSVLFLLIEDEANLCSKDIFNLGPVYVAYLNPVFWFIIGAINLGYWGYTGIDALNKYLDKNH